MYNLPRYLISAFSGSVISLLMLAGMTISLSIPAHAEGANRYEPVSMGMTGRPHEKKRNKAGKPAGGPAAFTNPATPPGVPVPYPNTGTKGVKRVQ